MALLTKLVAAKTTGFSNLSFTTPEFAVPSDCLLIAFITATELESSSDPTEYLSCVSSGLTFEDALLHGTDTFYAIGTKWVVAPVTTGGNRTLTISCGGRTCLYQVQVFALAGYDPVSVIGATATGYRPAAVGVANITLSDNPLASSIVLAAAVHNDTGPPTVTAGSAWTEKYQDLDSTNNIVVQTQSRTGSTSTDVQWNATPGGAVGKTLFSAVEFKVIEEIPEGRYKLPIGAFSFDSTYNTWSSAPNITVPANCKLAIVVAVVQNNGDGGADFNLESEDITFESVQNNSRGYAEYSYGARVFIADNTSGAEFNTELEFPTQNGGGLLLRIEVQAFALFNYKESGLVGASVIRNSTGNTAGAQQIELSAAPEESSDVLAYCYIGPGSRNAIEPGEDWTEHYDAYYGIYSQLQTQSRADSVSPYVDWDGTGLEGADGYFGAIELKAAEDEGEPDPIEGESALSDPTDTLAADASVHIGGTVALSDTNDTLAATGGGKISGTVALADTGDTCAATGSSSIHGTAAGSDVVETLAAAGTLSVHGSAALTDPTDTLAAGGAVRVSGTASLTELADTLAGSGVSVVHASGALSDTGDTLAASGKLDINGTVVLTDPNDTFYASGGVVDFPPIYGTVALTDTADTIAANGKLLIVGSSSLSDSLDTFACSASVKLVGTSALTEINNDVLASSVNVKIHATSNLVDVADSFAANGKNAIHVSIAIGDALDAFSSTGSLKIHGYGALLDSTDTFYGTTVPFNYGVDIDLVASYAPNIYLRASFAPNIALRASQE